MPRVKKKSVEYGNRKRRKLAATKRSTLYCSSPVGERQFVQMQSMENHLQLTATPTPSPPPPPPSVPPVQPSQLQPPQPTPQQTPPPTTTTATITKACSSPVLLPKSCPVEVQTEEKCLDTLKMEDSKTELKNSTFPEALKDESLSDAQRSELRRKYFSDLLSRCIITADKAVAAVMAVRCDSAAKKPSAVRKPRVPRKPKVEKANKQKVYAAVSKLPNSDTEVSKAPPAPNQTATSKVTTANSKATGSTPPASNTQKAYALYVGGQLKYILPYNGLLAATNPNQPEGEMKKLICRGVNGKTEIALAKPTIVCDNEKKKIVFVVQKKSPDSPSQIVSTKTTTENKASTKSSNLLTYGSFLNHGISDNMLKLLLPSFVPSEVSTTATTTPTPTKSTTTTTLPATTVGSKVTSAKSQSDVNSSQIEPASTDRPKDVSVATYVNSTGNNQNVGTSGAALTTTTTSTKTLTTAVVTSTTPATLTTAATPTTATTPATTTTTPATVTTPATTTTTTADETTEDSGSIHPVKLFSRDSARKLCPPTSSSVSSVPVPTILDASEVQNSSGKSLLRFSSVLNENKQKIQSHSKQRNEAAAAERTNMAPTESHSENVVHQDKTENSGKAISNSDTNCAKNLSQQSESVMEDCHSDSKEVSQDNADDGDDDGMFGLKISSVFSLAEEQLRSSEDDVTASQLGENSEFVKPSSDSSFFHVEQPQIDGFAENDNLPNESKFQRVLINSPQSTSSLSSPRTVVVSMNNEAFTSPVQLTNSNEEVSVDISIDSTNHRKHMSADHEKTTKLPPNAEQDLDNFNMTDSQLNNSQKENASPKNSSCSDKTEQDPKYISVDIRRRNGQTKVTAVTNPNLKKESAKSIASTLESVSSVTSLGSAIPQGNSSTRLADELQCAAHSLPMGKYVFIPLSDKTVAIPSQGGKTSRSAYIFEKSFNQNSMQVKMPKSFVNTKDCPPPTVVSNTNNGSQIIFQTNNASKSLNDVIITPSADPLPSSTKETVPTLEAPPIITGKRIRRPKKHTGFEEDIDFIPPVRKYRKKSKSVLKEKKSGMVASDNPKKTKSHVPTPENNNCLYYMKEGSNKIQLFDSKSELATVLRATGTALEISKVDPVNGHRLLPSCSTGVVPSVTMVTPKVAPSVGSIVDPSYQSCNSSGLRIDNVLSLQPNTVHIKSEPITSGYGDELVKSPHHVSLLPLNPLITLPPTSVPDSLNLVQNIKKEPVKYGYEGDINPDSSVSLLAPINQHSSLSSIKEEKLGPCPENVACKNLASTQKDVGHLRDSSKLYKMDKFTLSGSGKKLNCKKKAVGKKAAVKITGFPLETQTSSSSSVTDDLSYSTPSPSNLSPLLPASPSTSSSSCYSSHVSSSKHNSLELPSASTSSVTLSSSLSGETPQEERIRRLREILREKEHSLELIRQNLAVSSTL
ncbi:mucin-5AC [Octopus bimaculoides]|uniref:Uncharacterized protein n=1 Tax=Octopus bimaculoides TaxID=37653 RepID=A0A0L8HEZ1_OCTBM|nr:mucin-5AC [Octopus bimaculoides]XP_014772877.1 mucin-5AC [Octopus bimaculoides]|eukprot:XP_014772876.1 PREDICTED: mucin-5AC-like [Octopus bimaculoides]